MNLSFIAPLLASETDSQPRSPRLFYPDLDARDDETWNNSSFIGDFYIAPIDTKKYEPDHFIGTGRGDLKTDKHKKAA